jgi:hypothetical protein
LLEEVGRAVEFACRVRTEGSAEFRADGVRLRVGVGGEGLVELVETVGGGADS